MALQKMFISPASDSNEKWALFAIGGAPAPGLACAIDIKFVQTLRRPYQFSVDSFQIILDMDQLAPALCPAAAATAACPMLPPVPPPQVIFIY
jgi:hypothetical protein